MNVDHLLNQTCTIYSSANQNRFGKNAYGAGVENNCRFQRTNRIIQTPDGEKISIDAILTLSATAVAANNDKVVFNNETFRIMMVAPAVDGEGITRHYKLMVQNWSTSG
jgi:hypothetical protein